MLFDLSIGECYRPLLKLSLGLLRGRDVPELLLWAWIFHDLDDDDYEEEYGQTNTGFGGWAIVGVGVLGVWFLIRNLRRRSIG